MISLFPADKAYIDILGVMHDNFSLSLDPSLDLCVQIRGGHHFSSLHNAMSLKGLKEIGHIAQVE